MLVNFVFTIIKFVSDLFKPTEPKQTTENDCYFPEILETSPVSSVSSDARYSYNKY